MYGTCLPRCRQQDLLDLAQGHTVVHVVEANGEPPQAVTEGGYPAVETYHADKVYTAWTDAATDLFVPAYDDPDDVGIIKWHEQRG